MRALVLALCLLVGTAGLSPALAERPAAARAIALEGAPNFRDIGGYATVDGRHVIPGLVYRSDKLSALTAADVARLRRLAIHEAIDLRTREERQAEPDAWRARRVYESPKESLRTSFAAMRDPAATPESRRARMTASYAQMPANYAGEYAVMFHRLAAGGAPMLVHCTAGKDRTGVAMALLLSALGVPRATITSDYLLSNARLAGRAQAPPPSLSSADPALQRVAMTVEPEYLEAALAAVDAQYGSIDGYLRQALGMSDREISDLRRRLTR